VTPQIDAERKELAALKPIPVIIGTVARCHICGRICGKADLTPLAPPDGRLACHLHHGGNHE
jgi:hypothetical protein